MKKKNLSQRLIIIGIVTFAGFYVVIGPHGRRPLLGPRPVVVGAHASCDLVLVDVGVVHLRVLPLYGSCHGAPPLSHRLAQLREHLLEALAPRFT